MKKVLLFLLLLLPVFLISCSAKQGVTPLTRGIAFTCRMTCYNECYTGDALIKEDGTGSFTFTSPEEMRGLMLIEDENGIAAEFRGLRMEFDGLTDQKRSCGEWLFAALNDAAARSATVRGKEQTVCGTAAGLAYCLTVGATGLPIRLDAEKAGFCVEFMNVTNLSKQEKENADHF